MSNFLQSAGTGAAAGSKISPGLGTIIGAGVGGLSSLLSGYLGFKSQEKTNRLNLQIARETNEQQKELFERQLQYNSFVNQREMLEKAGYSPYSLFGTSSVLAGSTPQLQVPTMHAPTMFAEGVGNAMGNLAQIANVLSDASLKREQAKKESIENAIWQTKLYNDLVGQGLHNQWQQIQNYIAENSKEDQALTPAMQNELLHAQWNLTTQQYNLAIIEAGLRQEFGRRMSEAEIEKMSAEAYDAWQRGHINAKELEYVPEKYRIQLINANAAMKSSEAAESQAATAKFRAPAQNAADYGSAWYNSSMAEKVQYVLHSMALTLSSPEAHEILKLEEEHRKIRSEREKIEVETKLNEKMADLVSEKIEEARRRNDWRTVTKLTETLGNILGGSVSVSVPVK